MSITTNVLQKVSQDIDTTQEQADKATAEINQSINVIARAVDRMVEAEPERGKMDHYSSVSSKTSGRMIFLGMSLYGVTFTAILIQLAETSFATILDNIWMNVALLSINFIWQLWYNSTHVDTYDMVETIEKKGSLSPIRVFTMRLFTTRNQWKALTRASRDVQRYNTEVKAWKVYQSEIINSEESQKALNTLNEHSPRRRIFFTKDGEVNWSWKPRSDRNVTRANLREWTSS